MSTLTSSPPTAHRTWTRDGFLLSTDPSLISIPALTSAFAQDWMYWAKPLPSEAMNALVRNSLCFGLYTPTPGLPPLTDISTSSDAGAGAVDPVARLTAESRPAASRSTSSTGAGMIGFARVITDYTTFAYLTDVYVLPEWKGEGLGKWLVACVQEVFESMPHLRRSMLITGREGPAVGFYESRMRMERLDQGKELVVMSWQGPGWPGV